MTHYKQIFIKFLYAPETGYVDENLRVDNKDINAHNV